MATKQIWVRTYKRFDVDLLALYDNGYSLTSMMRDALVAYANGTPYHICLDEYLHYELSEKKAVRFRVIVKENGSAVAALLKGIKRGYISSFVKQVLRNALVQQNLTSYFNDDAYFATHQANLNAINIQAMYPYGSVVMASAYKSDMPALEVAKPAMPQAAINPALAPAPAVQTAVPQATASIVRQTAPPMRPEYALRNGRLPVQQRTVPPASITVENHAELSGQAVQPVPASETADSARLANMEPATNQRNAMPSGSDPALGTESVTMSDEESDRLLSMFDAI